jgi:flagellar biosynthesis protein
MRTVDDREVKLSDFKGKVVILDFWATWCGPCIASFPHTSQIAKQYKDQDVVVLASGTSDTIAAFKKWIPANAPKYPDILWAFDPNERGSSTFDERASNKHYAVVGIPTQFVIGRDGRIVSVIVGNGGAEDARTETALADAGVKVEAAVVAKGRGLIAEEIISRAREHGVFVHESPELVALLSRVDIDGQIPPQLYIAVAELLAWIYQVDRPEAVPGIGPGT